MKNIIIIVALFLTGAKAWAGGNITFVKLLNGVENQEVGEISAKPAGETCMLQLMPYEGYYATEANVTVLKVVDGGQAQAPRRTIGYADAIKVTPVNPDADPSQTTEYTFPMPDEVYDIEITVDFQKRENIGKVVVTLADGTFVFDGKEKCPEVLSVLMNDKEMSTKDYEVTYENNVNAGKGLVKVKGLRTYTGEVNQSFVIQKAKVAFRIEPPYDIPVNNASYALSIGHDSEYDQLFRYIKMDEIVITSSNPNVVSISDGFYHPREEGEALIKATFAGNQNIEAYEFEQVVHIYTVYDISVAGVTVTSLNRQNILGDDAVSFQFDGRQTLVVNEANLVSGSDQHIGSGISSQLDQLIIFLKGTSQIVVAESPVSVKSHSTVSFTTNGNAPGKLTLKSTNENPAVMNAGIICFEQNLAVISGDITSPEALIGTPVKPIAEKSGDENTITLEKTAGEDLNNTIIDDVLYTLSSENGDGYSAHDDCIVLSSTMIENDVNQTLIEYKPGTPEFAEHFAGLTFMIPAGTGRIIVNAKTGADGVLFVKIGQEEPYVVTDALDFQEFVFPYACPEATYVYIYNGSQVETGTSAPHRAGKKTTITVGIHSVGVASQEVQTSNSESESTENTDVALTIEAINNSMVDGSVVINDPTVTSLPDNIFLSLPFVKFIDLRNTNIKGVTVSRLSGAFKDVSKNTLIYMPAGNTSSEVNVVIGKVCQKVVLDPQMQDDESFALSGSFTAQKVVLDRVFSENQMAMVYLPFELSAISASAFGSFYTFGRSEGGFVKIEAVTGPLQAHTPYLFKSTADDVQISAKAATLSKSEENVLARRLAPSVLEDGFYGCYGLFRAGENNTSAYQLVTTAQVEDVRFERMTGSDVIRPFEAYLVLNNQETTSLKVTDDENVITELHAVSKKISVSDTWYTLTGILKAQRPVTKGVYLQGTNKIIIR